MRYLFKALPLVLLPMLSACFTTQTPPKSMPIPAQQSTSVQMGSQTQTFAADPLCSQIQIVHYALQDTDGTKEQVKANNAVLHRVCHV